MIEHAHRDERFGRDTAWTGLAYACMALAGAVINFTIARVRPVDSLGVFNQIYAIYVVAALLAVCGVHDSALKHAAEHGASRGGYGAVARGALSSALVTALPMTALFALASLPLGWLTRSDAVGRGLLAAAPGLLFFALNKTALGLLNGLRRMRAYALGQIARVALIATVIALIVATRRADWWFGLSFTAAEVLLFLGLVLALSPTIRRADPRLVAPWRRRHLRFGVRALPNSLLAESFVRVDILMLGFLVSDAQVGLYSFAALFVEGLYQLPIVIRTVANPILVELLAHRSARAIASHARRWGALALGTTVVVGAVVYLAFPLLTVVVPGSLVSGSRALLLVLLAGVITYAAFVPCDQILLQAGLPTKQSLLMAINLAVNVGLNAVLIVRLGAIGAAWATALAYLFSALSLNVAAARWLRLRPLLLLARDGGDDVG